MEDNGIDVEILGVGITPVGEHWEKSLRHLALDSIALARADAGGVSPQVMYVANNLAPALSGQSHLGALIADFAGLRGIEATTIEAAGASGGMAIRQAYLTIKSGAADVVLVVGVEKVTEKATFEIDAALATSSDAEFEAVQGVTPTAQAALLMQRYLYEFGAPEDALAGFSLTAHANAVSNPNAMFRRAIRLEQYQSAPMVSAPLNMFDAAPIADGSAAMLLARSGALPRAEGRPAVLVSASSASTSAIAVHDTRDPLTLEAAATSAQTAYQAAGLEPEEIDLFEIHDRFTIFAALALEAAGFAERGSGWKLAQNGVIGLEGKIPLMTFGGSKARGDSGGATGVYQAAEIALQLQDRAGENQIAGARNGMAQCLGGTGATAVTHIFQRL
jgi:acetyl-CoA C-acetyltransferase